MTTHPNDTVTAAVSIENPDQYVGSGVKLPAGFPSGEVDTGATVNDVPNPFPDIIGKIAFDPKIGHTHQHIDAARARAPLQDLQPRHRYDIQARPRSAAR